MTALFVTGTGTDIGKTFVTARLIQQARSRGHAVRALKPLLSGFDGSAPEGCDSAVLLAALGVQPSLENINAITPWRYAQPLAPNMAARAEGTSVDMDGVLDFCRAGIARAEANRETLYIEGVGGIMSPVADTATNLDWIAALGIPALLVAGTYLGAISHTLTAVAAMQTGGVALDEIVLSESQGEQVGLAETKGELERFLPNVKVGEVERATIR
jgi:dethiobiotin synthetase